MPGPAAVAFRSSNSRRISSATTTSSMFESSLRDALRSLDLVTGVEEEEGGDLDDEDVEVYASFERHYVSRSPTLWQNEVKLMLRRKRFGRHDQSPSGVQQSRGHSGDTDDEPSYVLQDQATPPGPDEVYMFSLQVKVSYDFSYSLVTY